MVENNITKLIFQTSTPTGKAYNYNTTRTIVDYTDKQTINCRQAQNIQNNVNKILLSTQNIKIYSATLPHAQTQNSHHNNTRQPTTSQHTPIPHPSHKQSYPKLRKTPPQLTFEVRYISIMVYAASSVALSA